MKNKIVLLIIIVLAFGCKPKVKSSTEKIPAVETNIATIKKIIANKTWQVIDAATIIGSRPSAFAKPESPANTITAPNVANLKWFSEIKGLDNATDFTLKFYKESFDKYKKISLLLNKDTVATTTGLEKAKQMYTINDAAVSNEANGVKLKLAYSGTAFGNVSKMTATYYVLGINEKMLYLLTPNTMNEEKIVFLLEAK